MEDEIMDRLVDGVYKREYSLLLGAGASIGSSGGNNQPLPSGPQFCETLINEFDIETEGRAIALPRAYAAAKRRDPERLERFLRHWFTGCKPDWQPLITDFDWHRLWTLNIDDIVEVAYDNRNINIDRFNWTSTFRDSSRSDHQIVHLHGFAKDTSDPDQSDSDLVFSVREYAAVLNDPRAWHAVFTDEFAERPFIILGASLIDEHDLQEAMTASAAETTRGYPSVIVLRSVSAFERDELTDLGLTVVESDSRSFMEELHARTREYRLRLQGSYNQSPNPQFVRFLQQYIDLRQYEPQPSESTRNFYAGYEPHWRNILDSDDASMDTTDRSLATIQESLQHEDNHQVIHLLTGNAGTGKSTGILRIARQLIADGLTVYQFRGDENLDVSATIRWLERMPDTVLIFDDCADFADSIGELAEQCALSNVRLQLIGAERSRRRSFLQHKIAQRFLNVRSEYVYGLLSDHDIASLVDKLTSRRRLGHITRRALPQQYMYFRSTASRRLFEGMANLEGGTGFRIRIRSDYHRIDDDNLRRLYAACSIAFELGYSLPLGISSRIVGLSARGLQTLLASDEQDMLLIDSNGVRPPHRLTAALVVESALSEDDRFDAMRRLVLALAPHIDIRALISRTRPYRLLRRLMDQEAVLRLVGEVRGRSLYEVMEDPYDWNGRYWEQRALFESALGNHPQARSYAEHSLLTHRHPFAFNTLGTILGRIALQSGDADSLREAVQNLKVARDERRWEASEHPYVTFFTTMIRFGQQSGPSAMPVQLRNTFDEWLMHASNSPIFMSREGEEQLKDFQRDWLYLATTP